MDTYRNLTLKTLTMMHWTLTHCPHATWLLKSDDDVLINPFALKSVLAQQEGASFVCRVKVTSSVCRIWHRCPKKWAVSLNEYRTDRYPTYCMGAAYAISASMVKKLYAVANKTHPLFLEDAYVTGILAQAYQARYFNVRVRYLRATQKLKEKYWNGRVLFMIFNSSAKNVSSYVLYLWDRIVDYNNLTSLLTSP